MQTIVQDILSGELLTRQLTSIETVHLGFVEGFSENPLATMLTLGAILFVTSVACRYVIYAAVRFTGRERYDGRGRALENLWSLLALGVGFIAGEVCFQNLWLAVLTGGGFAVVSFGAVLEGLVANENARRARLARGLKA